MKPYRKFRYNEEDEGQTLHDRCFFVVLSRGYPSLSVAVLYIFWVLVNIVLGVLFVSAWYRCLQLFAKRYSRSASVALCVLTLMMCKGGANSVYKLVDYATDVPAERPLVLPVRHTNRLLTLPFTQLDQRIYLEPLHQTCDLANSIRIKQIVRLMVLSTGLRWESRQQLVRLLPSQRVEYTVQGTLHWRLLNLDIYAQPLAYQGILSASAQPSR
jgi:hypothetical protein